MQIGWRKKTEIGDRSKVDNMKRVFTDWLGKPTSRRIIKSRTRWTILSTSGWNPFAHQNRRTGSRERARAGSDDFSGCMSFPRTCKRCTRHHPSGNSVLRPESIFTGHSYAQRPVHSSIRPLPGLAAAGSGCPETGRLPGLFKTHRFCQRQKLPGRTFCWWHCTSFRQCPHRPLSACSVYERHCGNVQ